MPSIPIKSNLHTSLLFAYLQCSYCYSCFPSAHNSSKVEILLDTQMTKYCSFTHQSLLSSRKILTETSMILCTAPFGFLITLSFERNFLFRNWPLRITSVPNLLYRQIKRILHLPRNKFLFTKNLNGQFSFQRFMNSMVKDLSRTQFMNKPLGIRNRFQQNFL